MVDTPSVRRAGVPPEKQRYNVDLYMEGPALRVSALDRPEDEDAGAAQGGGSDSGHRYQAGGGLQGGNQLLLFGVPVAIQWTADRNKNLTLQEFGGSAADA